HAPGPVRLANHFTDCQTEGIRQALAAVFGIQRQARPAAFNELLIGFLEAGRRFHAFRRPGAPFGIANPVQRGNDLLTEFGTFLEDGINHVGGSVFASRQAAVMFFISQYFVAHETDVAQGSLVFWHGVLTSTIISGFGTATSRTAHSNTCLKLTFQPRQCQAPPDEKPDAMLSRLAVTSGSRGSLAKVGIARARGQGRARQIPMR